MNRYLILGLHIISLVLLGFGWVLDVLHINISVHYIIDFNLFNEKRSILGMLKKLWNDGNYWPFSLIFLFGIIVPLLKSVVIFYLLLVKNPLMKWQSFVNVISKWAMADVFAISIFVAFLGANAMENTKAVLQPGFYYFTGYVILGGIVAMYCGKMLSASASNKV
ncbi:MAG: paraquat-inducible protein A [Chitinophagaceae bacterium]|nr:paraquat-inducible protein A [Chitinophagaceae bacterium]HQW92877.1 paraquat-inducible protein A [Ferruginibacter sp.]